MIENYCLLEEKLLLILTVYIMYNTTREKIINKLYLIFAI